MEPPSQNYKLIIEYDGSRYAGWQRQKDLPTIQGAIEEALGVMTRQKVTLHGSGRTDAGVHALAQCAHFTCSTSITADGLKNGLNSLLLRDIRIKECQPVDDDFHARHDAISKTYEYRIINTSIAPAIGRQYAWHIRRPLNQKAMSAALSQIAGRHDFKTFEGSGSPRSSTIRTIFKATLAQAEQFPHIAICVKGNGFLKHMVRNIAGTVVDVGLGKITLPEFDRIVQACDRTQAGITAPARGLFLIKVEYA